MILWRFLFVDSIVEACSKLPEIVDQRSPKGLLVESSCLSRRSLSAVAYLLQLRWGKAGVAENLLLGLAGF